MPNKTIYGYFDNEKRVDCIGEMFPYNTVYEDVTTSLLDGYINISGKSIICYTLDYYRNNDIYKQEEVEHINNIGFNGSHTKISMMEDDILIINHIEEDCYMYFWYHISGRCDIGRFKTKDTHKQIELSVINWLDILKSEEYITGYSKLDSSKYLKGWISY